MVRFGPSKMGCLISGSVWLEEIRKDGNWGRWKTGIGGLFHSDPHNLIPPYQREKRKKNKTVLAGGVVCSGPKGDE